MTVTNDDLLTAALAAALLPATTAQTVLRWAKQGRIAYVELPGGRQARKFFRRSDIEAILKPKVAVSSRPERSGQDASA